MQSERDSDEGLVGQVLRQADNIQIRVARYYDCLLQSEGPTHKGVGWNSQESHLARLTACTEAWRSVAAGSPTLLDWGCGYGAYLDYITSLGVPFSSYLGVDLNPRAIGAARERHGDKAHAQWRVGSFPEPADVILAIGVFSVIPDNVQREAWTSLVSLNLRRGLLAARQCFVTTMLREPTPPFSERPSLFWADRSWVEVAAGTSCWRNLEVSEIEGTHENVYCFWL